MIITADVAPYFNSSFFVLVVKEDSKSSKAKAPPKVVKNEPKKTKNRKNPIENQSTNRSEATTSPNPSAAKSNESKRSRNNPNPANLNKKNQKGETPLHAACCKVRQPDLMQT